MEEGRTSTVAVGDQRRMLAAFKCRPKHKRANKRRWVCLTSSLRYNHFLMKYHILYDHKCDAARHRISIYK